jgi:hypothetical protein
LVHTSSERNSAVLTNPFVSQRLTRVLKPPKRPLPTTFLPQKAYFQSDRIFPLSFQRLSRATYLYRRNLQPIRRTKYLPTEAIECKGHPMCLIRWPLCLLGWHRMLCSLWRLRRFLCLCFMRTNRHHRGWYAPP